jgi:hypothetical protein
MTMNFRRILLASWIPIVLMASGCPIPAVAGDRLPDLVLERRHPTRVSWAEVEVAEASGIKVWKGERQREFARAMSLIFVGRTRKEEIEDLLSGSGKARSDIAPIASLLVAGNFASGDKAWNGFRD